MAVPGGLPNQARIYDYVLKGDEEAACYSTPLDRDAARAILELNPAARGLARKNREFAVTVARRAAEDGVTQILDLGCGLPSAPSVHEAARKADPSALVAYVDLDPLVKDAWEAAGLPGGVTAACADIEDPGAVLACVPLDMGQPACILLTAVLHLLKDPLRAVQAYREALAPGSWLAISAVSWKSAALLRKTEELTGCPVRSTGCDGLDQALAGMTAVPPGPGEVAFWLSGIAHESRGKPVRLLAGAAVKPGVIRPRVRGIFPRRAR